MVEEMSLVEEVHRDFDKLRGNLCGLIESWGLDSRRERGAINTLKELTYFSEDKIKKRVEELENEFEDLEDAAR